MVDARYSISTVSRCFGQRVSALRYYDEIGLVPATERRGNRRYYDRVALRRLALVQRLHRDGMVDLSDTLVLTGEPTESTPSSRDVLTRTVAALTERITSLTQARNTLTHLLECPADDPVQRCSYLRADLDDTVNTALLRERD